MATRVAEDPGRLRAANRIGPSRCAIRSSRRSGSG